MYRILDKENWNRKEHFDFFYPFDEPYFGLVAEIDCTEAYHACKQKEVPFFLFYHYQVITAVNRTEPFRYRIQDDQVRVYDTIHLSTTIAREDHTFAFSFVPYVDTFAEFVGLATAEIARIGQSTGLGLDANAARLDVIHCSTIPWVSFTGLTHARSFTFRDSVPKISFGKFVKRDNRLFMPVSVNVHHALMDGYHVGQFLQLLEVLLNDATPLLDRK